MLDTQKLIRRSPQTGTYTWIDRPESPRWIRILSFWGLLFLIVFFFLLFYLPTGRLPLVAVGFAVFLILFAARFVLTEFVIKDDIIRKWVSVLPLIILVGGIGIIMTVLLAQYIVDSVTDDVVQYDLGEWTRINWGYSGPPLVVIAALALYQLIRWTQEKRRSYAHK